MERESDCRENHIAIFLGCSRTVRTGKLCALYAYDGAEKENYEGQGGGGKSGVSC